MGRSRSEGAVGSLGSRRTERALGGGFALRTRRGITVVALGAGVAALGWGPLARAASGAGAEWVSAQGSPSSAADPLAEGEGAPKGPRNVDELLASFRKSPGLSARFVEEKHIALLKAPLRSEGALYYLPKDKLARHVERPKRSVLLLDGPKLSVSDAAGSRALDLSTTPALAALVLSFVEVLRGDRSALDANYGVEFVSPAEPKAAAASWRLTLTPRAEALRKMVTRIELSGVEDRIERLVVAEASGDRSVTHFSEVDTKRRFTEEERKRFFSTAR